MNLNVTRNIVPPTGILCPINQTVQVSGQSFLLNDLPAKMLQPCPTGFQLRVIGGSGQATDIFVWDGAQFEDDINGGTAANQTISGSIQLCNPASYDIEIVW